MAFCLSGHQDSNLGPSRFHRDAQPDHARSENIHLIKFKEIYFPAAQSM